MVIQGRFALFVVVDAAFSYGRRWFRQIILEASVCDIKVVV